MLHTEKLRARAAGGKLQNPFRLQKVGRRTPAGQVFAIAALRLGTPDQGAAVAPHSPCIMCGQKACVAGLSHSIGMLSSGPMLLDR